MENAYEACQRAVAGRTSGGSPYGTSGRMTLVTNSVKAKCDPVVVAVASKHKDPKSLKGYLKPDDSVKLEAGFRCC